jgi:L-ribulose-5-phosphate 3-epimerase
MRLGAITDEFSPDPEIAAAAMRAAGLETAELRVLWGRNILDLNDIELDRALAIFSKQGLAIDSIASPLFKCVLPGDAPLDRRFERDVFNAAYDFADQARLTNRAFDIAHRCGAGIVRVFSFWRTAQPETVFERVVDLLMDLAEQASDADLTIGLENEHACNIATTREAARVLAALDHPNLKIVWDPANALVAGESPESGGLDLLPVGRIAHVHAKDCRVVDGQPQWMAFGAGDVGWREQIQALRQAGYAGDINLETHWTGPNGDKLEASRICAQQLRQTVAQA